MSLSIEAAALAYREAIKRQDAALRRAQAARTENEEAREAYEVARSATWEAEQALLAVCVGTDKGDE